MPLFQFWRELWQTWRETKNMQDISAQEILGKWIYRNDDVWITFAFAKNGVCDYLDDDGDDRSWYYSVSDNKLKVWGSDKSKAELFQIYFRGSNLIINGNEYTRAQK